MIDSKINTEISLRDYLASKVDGKKEIAELSIPAIEHIMGEAIPTTIKERTMYLMRAEARLQYMKADAILIERELTNKK